MEEKRDGGTGRSRGRGTTIRIYCVKTESIFNKRKNEKKGSYVLISFMNF